MKNLKKVFTLLVILFTGLILSCQIGLGAAVDTEVPTLELDGNIPSGSIVRGPFTIAGNWKDDGQIKSIVITMENRATKEKESYEAEFRRTGDKPEGTWDCIIDPLAKEKNLRDGDYNVEIVIKDRYAHERSEYLALTLDNTAPVVALTRPSKAMGATTFDSYGQEFSVTGYIGDICANKFIKVEIYDSDKDDATCVYTTPVTKVNSEFTLVVASQNSSDKALADAYKAIYGDNDTGTKNLYCKVYAYDEAVLFSGDKKDTSGNLADYFYLYDDLYSDVFESYAPIELYEMLNSSREATDDVIAVLTKAENQIKKGQFSVNPVNNPSYRVSGRTPLNKDGKDFSGSDRNITNGTTVVVEIDPGLDQTPLYAETLGLYVIEWDSVNNKIKDGATELPLIKPLLIKNSEGKFDSVQLNEDEVKARNEALSNSGSQYKFKYTLINGKGGLKIGTKYIFGIYGYDKKGVIVNNISDTYGFLFSTNVVPEITIKNPVDLNTYLKAGKDFTISGSVLTEVNTPDYIYFYLNKSADPFKTITADQLTAKPADSKYESDFSITIPAATFADGGLDEYSVKIKAIYCNLPAEVQRTIIYDTKAPTIDISAPGKDAWQSSIGKVQVNAEVTDNRGATEAVYYSTTATEFTEANKNEWKSITSSVNSKDLVSTDKQGKSVAFISFVAMDKAGNQSDVVTRYINVDSEKPAMNILSYNAEGGEAQEIRNGESKSVQSKSFSIRGNYSDNATNVTVTVKREGESEGTVAAGSGSKSGEWTYSENDIAEGSYTYEITAADESGKSVTQKVTITADVTAPTAAISAGGMPDAEALKGASFQFGGTASDYTEGSGVSLVQIRISDKADSSAEGAKFYTGTATGTANWSYKDTYTSDGWKDVFAVEGTKYITLIVTDKAGNKAEIDAGSFIYDRADPVLKVTYGATQEFMTEKGFSFEGTASDTFKLDSLRIVEQKFNKESGKFEETEASKNADVSTVAVGADGKWSAKVPLVLPGDDSENKADGKYQYQFVLSDVVDHQVFSALYTTTVDKTAPKLTITTPLTTEEKSNKLGEKSIDESSFKFAGTIEEDNGISGIWYKILAYDGEIPVATPTAPEGNPLDASLWTADGWFAADAGNSNFKFTQEFKEGTSDEGEKLGEGHKKLFLIGVDTAGNVSSVNICLFDVDMKDPELAAEITTGDNCKTKGSTSIYYFNSEKITGTYSSSDNNGIEKVEIKIVGKDENGNDRVESAGTVLENGTWEITKDKFINEEVKSVDFIATDKMGKTTKKSFSVAKDFTAPVIVISTPVNGDVINSATVSVNGSITENGIGVGKNQIYYTTKLNPNDSDWTSILYSAGDSWNKNLPLDDEGSVTLKVKAADILGNIASNNASVTFNYDKAPPVLTVSKLDKYQNSNFTVTGTAKDTNSIAKVEIIDNSNNEKKYTYTFSDGEKTAGKTSDQNWSYTFKVGSANKTDADYLTEGEHTFRVLLYDVADRTSETIFTVTVDTEAPTVATPLPYPSVSDTEKASYRYSGEVEDETSNVANVEIAFANPEAATTVIKEASTSWAYNTTFAEETLTDGTKIFGTSGTKTVYVRAQDKAGNWSNWISQNFAFDTGKPTVTVDTYAETTTENPSVATAPSSYSYPATGIDASTLTGTSKVYKLEGTISDDWDFATNNKFVVYQIKDGDDAHKLDVSSYVTFADASAASGTKKTWTLSGLPRDPSDASKVYTALTGSYKYTFKVTDKVKKESDTAVTCVIDVDAPTVILTQPSESLESVKYISGDDYTFYGSSNDVGPAGLASWSYQFVKIPNNKITTSNKDTDQSAVAAYSDSNWTTTIASNGNWNFKKTLGKKSDGTDGDLADGKWILYYKAIDNSGNESSVNHIYFWVDTKNPVLAAGVTSGTNCINGGTAANPVYYFNGTSGISGSISATISSDLPEFITLSVKTKKADGTTTDATISNGTWTLPLTAFEEGKAQTITVSATDICGRVTSETFTVTKDTTAPEITITKPAENSQQDEQNINAEISLVENGIGIAGKTTTDTGTICGIEYSTDGTKWTPANFTTTLRFTQEINLGSTQGQKTLYVRGKDKLGNTATQKSVNFYYDYEDPYGEETDSVGAYVKSGTENFTLKGIIYDSYKYDYVQIKDTTANKTYQSKTTTNYADTSVSIAAKAVTLNAEPENWPKGYYTSSALDIPVTAAYANGTYYQAEWTKTIAVSSDLSEGNHNYKITVYDVSGRSFELSPKAVFVDTKAPSLDGTVELPSKDATRNSTYRFTGKAKDQTNRASDSKVANVMFKFTDVSSSKATDWLYATGTENWNYTLDFSDGTAATERECSKVSEVFATEGKKKVQIKVVDAAGNEAVTEAGTFTYDTGLPTVSVDSYKLEGAAAGETFAAGDVEKTFQINKVFSITGKATDTYGVDRVEIKQGSNLIAKVKGSDLATGGVWTVANLPRKSDFSVPAWNSESAETMVTAGLTGTADVTNNVVKSGNFEYTVTVYDIAGNVVSAKKVTARIDTVEPTVTEITKPEETKIFSGENSISGSSYTFSGKANDRSVQTDATSEGFGVVGIKYAFATTSEMPASDSTLWTSVDSTEWSFKKVLESGTSQDNTDSLHEGHYWLWVKAVDAAGNESTQAKAKSKEIYVDLAAPTVLTKVDGTVESESKTKTKTGAYSFKFKTEDSHGVESTDVVLKLENTVLEDWTKAAAEAARPTDRSYYTISPKETSGEDEGYQTITVFTPSGVDNNGLYEYTITAKDKVGKETSVTRNILLDTKAPDLNVNSPDLSKLQTSAAFSVLGSSEDASGTKAVWYAWDIEKPVPSSETTADASWNNSGWTKASGTTSWTIALTGITEKEDAGAHKLYIAAVDDNGKATAQDDVLSLDVRVDLNAPGYTGAIHNNDSDSTKVEGTSDTRNSGFTLKGTAEDLYGISSIEISYKKDGTVQSPLKWTSAADDTDTLSYDAATKEWSQKFVAGSASAGTGEIKLGDGRYVFSVKVTDNAGRVTNSSDVTGDYTVVVDTVAPVISSVTNGLDSNAADYRDVTRGEGEGAVTTRWYRKQAIPLTATLDASVANTSSITKVQYATNANPAEEDWKDFAGSGNSWSTTDTASEGLNSYKIRAIDAAGNVSTQKSINVYADTTAPKAPEFVSVATEGTAAVTAVPEEYLVNGQKKVTVVVKASDENNGSNETQISGVKEVSCTTGSNTVTGTKQSDDSYSIEIPADKISKGGVKVTVTDNAGWTTTETLFNFDLDNQKPTVTIDALRNDGKETGRTDINGKVTVSGTAKDNKALLTPTAAVKPVVVKYYYADAASTDAETGAITAPAADWTGTNTAIQTATLVPANATETDVSKQDYSTWSFELDTTAVDKKYLFIQATVTDSAANVCEKPAEYVVYVNQMTDIPVITIEDITSDGAVVGSQKIDVIVEDDDGNLKGLWWTADSTVATAKEPAESDSNSWTKLNSTNGNYKVAFTKDDANLNMYFYCIDAAGNKYKYGGSTTLTQTTEPRAPYVKYGTTAADFHTNTHLFGFSIDTKPAKVKEFSLSNAASLPDTVNIESIKTYNTSATWSEANGQLFGGKQKYMFAKVVVLENTGMSETKPVEVILKNSEGTAIKYATSRKVTLNAEPQGWPAGYFTDEALTTQASATYVDGDYYVYSAWLVKDRYLDNGNYYYDYVVGPIDVSEKHTVGSGASSTEEYLYPDESLVASVNVYDIAGEGLDSTVNFVVDNKAPVIDIKYPIMDVTNAITSTVTMKGTLDDGKGAGIEMLEYKMTADANTAWKLVTRSAAWEIPFISADRTSEESILYYANNTYATETALDSAIWKVPVYFKVTDKLGNVTEDALSKENPAHFIYVDAEGGIPKSSISSPEPNASIGGSVTIIGTASDDIAVKDVRIQLDVNNDNQFTEADYTAIAAWNNESLKLHASSSDDANDWYIEADGTNSWKLMLTTDKLPSIKKTLSSEPEAWPKGYYTNEGLTTNAPDSFVAGDYYTSPNLGMRVTASDDDGQLRPFAEERWVKVDKGAPSFGKLKVVVYQSGNTGAYKIEREYSEGMFISNKLGNWYLVGEVTDDTWAKSLSYSNLDVSAQNRIPVNVASPLESGTSEGTKTININMPLPVDNDGEIYIRMTAIDGDTKSGLQDIRISVDNTAPKIYKADGTPTTSETDELRVTDKNGKILGTTSSATTAMIVNSDGVFTLKDSIEESGSKVQYVAFYFKRIAADESNPNPRTYNPMGTKTTHAEVRNNLSSTIYENDEKLVVKKYTDSTSGENRSALDSFTAEGISTDENIRVGGLIKIGGAYSRISAVNGNTVKFAPTIDTKYKDAEFVYAQIIDHALTESATNNNFNNVQNDDGDGMVESLTSSGSKYDWEASIFSNRIPDGPIELHIVAFDYAGNSVHGSVNTYISNNRPRIARVLLGTDLNGNGRIDFNGNKAIKNKNETNSTADGTSFGEFVYYSTLDSGNNAQSQIKLASSDFIVKKDMLVIPEFVGGNGSLGYVMKVADDSDAEGEKTTGAVTALTTKATLTDATNPIVADTSADNTTKIEDQIDAKGAIYLTKSDVTSYESVSWDSTRKQVVESVKNFAFTIWDTTEETVQGQDSQWALLEVPVKVDVTDDRPPAAFIRPFYWYGNEDNSILMDTNTQKLGGHIELEKDLTFEGSTFKETSGVLDKDPKVSGQIRIEGYAYDESKLNKLNVGITGFKLNEGTAGDLTTLATFGATGWTYAKADANVVTDGWKFTVEDTNGVTGDGHLVKWILELDTSRVLDDSGNRAYAGLDKIIQVQVTDGTNTSASSTAQTGTTDELTPTDESGSSKERVDVGVFAIDGTGKVKVTTGNGTTRSTVEIPCTPYYRMDIVPYISSVKTMLNKYKANNPSVYNRTALGHYPVRAAVKNSNKLNDSSNEIVEITGFNLSGGAATVDLSTEKLSSGNYVVKTNGIDSLNNINNNDVDYNSQGNGDNNDALKDDVIFDVWEINDRAAVGIGGSIKNPAMNINPSNGQVGFAFASEKYFSMPGNINGNYYSNYYWTATNGSLLNSSFTYNNNGQSFGTIMGSALTDETSDNFLLYMDRLGPGAHGTNGTSSGIGGYRLEQLGYKIPSYEIDDPNNPGEKITIPASIRASNTRIQSPVVVANGSKIYLAYYDDLKQNLCFKSGNLPDTLYSWKEISLAVSGWSDASFAKANKGDKQLKYTVTYNVSGSTYKSPFTPGKYLKITVNRSDEYYQIVSQNYTEKSNWGGLSRTITDTIEIDRAIVETGTPTLNLYEKIPTTFGAFVDQYSSNELANYSDANIQTIATTTSGKYVSMDVIPSTATSGSGNLVAVWFDQTNHNLMYSYNVTPNSLDGTKPNGDWSTNTKILRTNAGEYCKVKADANGGIHITCFEYGTGDILYFYMPSVDGIPVESVVDTDEVKSFNLSLDVVKPSADAQPVPYISWYCAAIAQPRMAYLVNTNLYNARSVTDGMVNGKYTGNWEITVIPTINDVQRDNVNVALWKNAGVQKTSDTGTSTWTHIEDAEKSTSYGVVYGNGTENPVMGYVTSDGTKGYIETAQMR